MKIPIVSRRGGGGMGAGVIKLWVGATILKRIMIVHQYFIEINVGSLFINGS